MKVAELIGLVCQNMPNSIPDSSFVNWINILEHSIYNRFLGKEPPEPKTIENIGQEELTIEQEFGLEWRIIYEYYLYAQICITRQEFGTANNYILLYNQALNDFLVYYNRITENTIRDNRLRYFR